jgi:hypothetical protein
VLHVSTDRGDLSSEPSWECLTLKITALRLFETSGPTYLTSYPVRVIYVNQHLHIIKFQVIHKFAPPPPHVRGRDSSVGIATRYGLEGPGIESRWGRDFPHLCRPAMGPTQPPRVFLGVKAAGS